MLGFGVEWDCLLVFKSCLDLEISVNLHSNKPIRVRIYIDGIDSTAETPTWYSSIFDTFIFQLTAIELA